MSGKFLNEETKKKIRVRRKKRRVAVSAMTQWITALVIVAILLLNLFTHVLQIVRYSGNGMEPNLSSGQTLILQKTQEVEQGDIIAFYYNNQILVRRVISLGGRQISLESDGTVMINSQKLEEPYLTAPSIGQCNLSFPYHIQSGYVFVMGDNRAIAMDSRLKEIGPIPEDRIIGKVLLAI